MTVFLDNPRMPRSECLSLLWIFTTANYIVCDVLTLMDPAFLRVMMRGGLPGLDMNQKFLLGAAGMMEIPISMILLSRFVRSRYNRWLNIGAGVTMTAVQIGSLFVGSAPTLHYWFFSAIEICSTLGIVCIAWNWKLSNDSSSSVAAKVKGSTPNLVAVVCLLYVGFVSTAHADGWKSEFTSDGKVAVQYKVADQTDTSGATTTLVEYKAKMTGNVNYRHCLAVLQDISKHKLINGDETSELLRTVSETEKIVYYRLKMPWPLPKTDCVARMIVLDDSAKGVATVTLIGAPEQRKGGDGRRIAVYGVTYVLKDLGNGNTELSSQGRARPPFAMPKWLIRTSFPGAAADPLLNIVRLANHER